MKRARQTTRKTRVERGLRREWSGGEGETVVVIRGQLVDANDARPLGGAVVEVVERGSDVVARDRTDPLGRFATTLNVPSTKPGRAVPSAWLALRVLDRDGRERHREERRIRDGEASLGVIEVPAAPSRSDPMLRDVVRSLRLPLADHMVPRLERIGIRTLGDLRRASGGDAIVPMRKASGAAMRRLEAVADLDAITRDPAVSDFLRRQGFADSAAVARSSRAAVVSRIRKRLGDTTALRVYTEAWARTALLEHDLVTDRLYEMASGASGGGGKAKNGKEGPPGEGAAFACACEECDAAVSPRAYLVDLLDYTLRHLVVERAGAPPEPVTPAHLEDRFKLRFADLLDTCEASTRLVWQVRLCIEVLRRATGTPSDSTVRAYLEAEERRYREAAYDQLLQAIGTSHDELRLARGAAHQVREQLAKRLGFHLEAGGVHRLDALYVPDVHQVSEDTLLLLFGLPGTRPGVQAPPGVPEVAGWRRSYLRTTWQQQDWNSQPASDDPVIDPDLIGPDDFREQATGALTPFGLWTSRRQAVDADLASLAAKVPDVTAMLLQAYGTVPNLDQLGVALESGADPEAAITAVKLQTGLAVESFVRLKEVRDLAANDPAAVTSEDWEDVVSILAQATKVKSRYAAWKQAESQAGVVLGPEAFWTPLQEPAPGPWPPAGAGTRALIDPDVVQAADLRDVMVSGQPGAALWQARAADLEALSISLTALVPEGSVVKLVKTALARADTPSQIEADLDALALALQASRAAGTPAPAAIDTEYHLTPDEFDRVMAWKAAAASLDPAAVMRQEDWAELIVTLKAAFKRKADWRGEEGNAPYWMLLRMQLSNWRGGQSRRLKWQQALDSRRRRPIIDPDLLHESDFARPEAGDAAYDLMVARRSATSQQLASLAAGRQAAASTAAWLTDTLQALGLSDAEMDTLVARREAGERIEGRLDQLDLRVDGFARIAQARAILAAGGTPDAAEWRDVDRIITAAYKRRQFGTWRVAERQAGITLGPDHFAAGRPVVELPRWLASATDRRDWERTLDTRMAQETAVVETLAAAVDRTEEQTLGRLRDALVYAAYKKAHPGISTAADMPDQGQDARARWATETFLIDAEASACRKTTRVGQAIETLQTLLVGVRNGVVHDAHPDLALDADTFDADWRWLGAFAVWRSAMLAFLYPENLLLPSLRRQHTPAFASLLSTLRMGGRVTPDVADQAARAFSDAFLDICRLEIGATDYVDALGRVVMVARGGFTGRLYWSTAMVSSETDASDAQSFWAPLPGLEDIKVSQIVGIAQHSPDPSTLRSFLILRGVDSGGDRLFVLAYGHVPDTGWSEPQPLDVDGTGWSVLLAREDQRHRPPGLLLWSAERWQYRQLNRNGSGWGPDDSREGDFASYKDLAGQTQPLRGLVPVCLVVRHLYTPYDFDPKKFFLLAFDGGDQRLKAFQVREGGDAYWGYLEHGWDVPAAGDWLGACLWTSKRRLVAIHRWTVGYRYLSLDVDLGNLTTIQGERAGVIWPDIRRMAISSTAYGDVCFVALDRHIDDNTEPAAILSRLELDANHHLVEEVPYPVPVAPVTRRNQIATSDLHGFDSWHWNHLRWDVGLNIGGPARLLVLLDEAYYYVPIHLALLLQQSGYYVEALDWFRKVYDYSRGPFNRFTYDRLDFGSPSLLPEQQTYERAADWLADPLDVHAAAAVRPLTDVRFILLAITRCLLDFADAEFTRDTAESVPHARSLYQFALKLLDHPILERRSSDCAAMIGELELHVGTDDPTLWQPLLGDLARVDRVDALRKVLSDVKEVLAQRRSTGARLRRAREVVADALERQARRPIRTLAETLSASQTLHHAWHERRLSDTRLARSIEGAQRLAGDRAVRMAARRAGRPFEASEAGRLAWRDERAAARRASSVPVGGGVRLDSVDAGGVVSLEDVGFTYFPVPRLTFCIPPNPLLAVLRLRGELNLYKLRHCRNIAGLERELEPYAVPGEAAASVPAIGPSGSLVVPGLSTIRATQYRYRALIERAKQLVALAQQAETAFLATLEHRDAAAYNLLLARQHARVAGARVRLQEFRLQEAEHGVTLAGLQRERAEIQRQHYADLLEAGWLGAETWAVGLLWASMGFQFAVAAVHTAGAIVAGVGAGSTAAGQGAGVGGVAGAVAGAVLDPTGQVLSAISGGLSTWSSALSMMASFERRRQEWELMSSLAGQDFRIGSAQVQIAQDQVRVVAQERVIAEIESGQTDNAVEFLSNKFTNHELYDWMSGVLERVYRFFLQQATAVARVAEAQLAFERQQVNPAILQTDYWVPPADGSTLAAGDERRRDRRGLTGSARLLQDIYQLDQHAFDTFKRLLQIAKTISLARLAPVEFQRLRETGVLRVTTPLALFDRDFPGHYVRLIRRVRASVIALIPPTEGIHATLSSTGISRVVIAGSGGFQTVVVRRDAESVALSSPSGATGLFDLEPQSDVLYPFEGLGVETGWEFRLPRASNLFDFGTLADVLLTIEYTALDDPGYRGQIIAGLDRTVRAERPFGFRHQFADAWYDLHNPELSSSPMTVRFTTRREDFPPNVGGLAVEHVSLYFSRADGETFEIPVRHLRFTEHGSGGPVGGGATTVNGLAGTRTPAGATWMPFIGRSPVGQWELSLPDREDIRRRFRENKIRDILFVVTYAGETPPWPA